MAVIEWVAGKEVVSDVNAQLWRLFNQLPQPPPPVVPPPPLTADQAMHWGGHDAYPSQLGPSHGSAHYPGAELLSEGPLDAGPPFLRPLPLEARSSPCSRLWQCTLLCMGRLLGPRHDQREPHPCADGATVGLLLPALLMSQSINPVLLTKCTCTLTLVHLILRPRECVCWELGGDWWFVDIESL